MKIFKYGIIIGIVFLVMIITNVNTKDLSNNISYIAKENVNENIKDNKISLEETNLSTDNKIEKKTVSYTNTTKSDLILTKDNVEIKKECNELNIDIYFEKNGKNYENYNLKMGENINIIIVFSYDNVLTDTSCSYDIALNMGNI